MRKGPIPKETFDEAVKVAHDMIRDTEEAFREAGASPAELLANAYRAWPVSTSGPLLRQMRTPEDYLSVLIWCSRKVAGAWDSVSLIAQDLLREGECLPPELAGWVADRLAGRRPRPARRGRDPDENFERDWAIVDAVQWLVHNGFTATRGAIRDRAWLPAEACSEGGSACDAVAVAATMSYKNVERIWTKSAQPNSPIRRRKPKVIGITSDSPPRAILSYTTPEKD